MRALAPPAQRDVVTPQQQAAGVVTALRDQLSGFFSAPEDQA
jgi:hypothetical protein